MFGNKVSGDGNTTVTTKISKDHILTVKGLVLSVLVLSSAIPLKLRISNVFLNMLYLKVEALTNMMIRDYVTTLLAVPMHKDKVNSYY